MGEKTTIRLIFKEVVRVHGRVATKEKRLMTERFRVDVRSLCLYFTNILSSTPKALAILVIFRCHMETDFIVQFLLSRSFALIGNISF